MRILIATGIYPPDIGGPATYSKLLYEELPKEGFDVQVLSFGEVRHLPKLVRHIAYFVKAIQAGKHADIIFAQDPVSVGLPAMLAAKFLGKRFVLKVVGDYAWEQGTSRFGVHDSLDYFSKRYLEYPFFVRLLKRIEYRVALCAERVVVPSEYLAGIVSNWGIERKKITVVYNAYKYQEMKESCEELRKELRLEGKVILTASRLVPWKGFGTLIELFPSVLKEVPDATLYIVGSGPEEDSLKKLIREHNLEAKVILLGQLPRAILLRYLKAADLFVLNTFYEGFSHHILEAMSLGTPVLTTRVGGNPELIVDQQEGLLVAYNDKKALTEKIYGVLSGRIETKTMVESARKKSLKFTIERMIKDTITALS
ncbi:MAG: glycosyltransferase family 4 protein [Minisyncoccota bacterium]